MPAAKKYGSAVAGKLRSGWSRWTLHPEAQQAREADRKDRSDPAVQDLGTDRQLSLIVTI